MGRGDGREFVEKMGGVTGAPPRLMGGDNKRPPEDDASASYQTAH